MSVRGEKYTASDGSLWWIRCESPPIPTKAYDWSAVHDDYDGAPDAGDNRAVYGSTYERAVAAVETYIQGEV